MTVRIVHLDPDWFGDVEAETDHFEDLLGDVVVEAIDCDMEEIPERVGRADVLLSHYTGVDEAALEATGCSVVTRYATGVDGIDMEAATERGVRVTNVPTYCDVEVAEHVVAMAMALVRSLPAYDAATAAGEWVWDAPTVRPVSALTMGFLAFGRKARATAERASALGFDVCAHDPYLDDEEIRELGAEPLDFEPLLERADVLSVHAPLTPETEGMLDADAFARMPEGAILLNAARGAIVDESALLDALDDGTLAGAGLDVLATEPPEPDDPLLGREDVIVTPHAAWYSTRSVAELRRLGSAYAAAAYRGEACEGLVNEAALER